MSENRPEALYKESLVTALRRSGPRRHSTARLEADIAAGAPVNDDGTMNVIAYTAWILKEMADDD